MKRNDCVDLTKLILSYFVIGIHTKLFDQLLLPVFRIAVPVFFIYSSYFFFHRAKWNLLKFVRRNVQLYFFWFIVLLPITLFVRKDYTNGIIKGGGAVVKDLFVGSTFLASWYISALVIAIIIVNFVSKTHRKVLFIVTMIIVLALSLMASNYYFVIQNNSFLSLLLDMWIKYFGAPCNSFVVGVFWVGIGYCIAQASSLKLDNRKLLIGMLFSIVILFAESHLILVSGVETLSNEFYFALIPTAIFVVLFTLNCHIYSKCRAAKKTIYL